MKTMRTNTGIGYFVNAVGDVIGKYDLPIGEHFISEDCTAVDVSDRSDLNNIVIQNRIVSRDDILMKLATLDAICPRSVREYLLSVGYKGAVKPGKTKGVIEEAEEDALSLRAQLALIQ